MWRAFVAVALLAVVLAAVPERSHAGVYSVWAHCYDNHSWAPSNGSWNNLVAYTDCNNNGVAAGLKMLAPPQKGLTAGKNPRESPPYTPAIPRLGDLAGSNLRKSGANLVSQTHRHL